MKKTKRILALIGVILLCALYLSTFIFALIDSPWAYELFRIAVGATILVPVLLYAMMLLARVLGNKINSAEPKEPFEKNTKMKGDRKK